MGLHARVPPSCEDIPTPVKHFPGALKTLIFHCGYSSWRGTLVANVMLAYITKG